MQLDRQAGTGKNAVEAWACIRLASDVHLHLLAAFGQLLCNLSPLLVAGCQLLPLLLYTFLQFFHLHTDESPNMWLQVLAL